MGGPDHTAFQAPGLHGLLRAETDAAVIVGAKGGIGSALVATIEGGHHAGTVLGFARNGDQAIDILDERSVEAAAASVKRRGLTLRLLLVATGVLQSDTTKGEKSLRDIDPGAMMQMFAVNTLGPALVLKHFLPLVPRKGRSLIACLSARVGSIGDNRLGGWYSYRASKAALNQLVKCTAIELSRKAPEAICVALHPGTVATRLTEPFAKTGLEVQAPTQAAQRLISVFERLETSDSGGFFDHKGERIEW